MYSPDASPIEPMIAEGLQLSIDLEGTEKSDIVGYRALHDTPPIDLAKINSLRSQSVLGTHSQKCQENDCA